MKKSDTNEENPITVSNQQFTIFNHENWLLSIAVE
jgi:hypothetical protein